MNASPGGWASADLRRLLSPARFDRYVTAAGSPDAAAVLYAWNLEVSGAWYETLGMFEVVLRNALDAQLITYHRKVRHGNGNWCADAEMPWKGARLADQLLDARKRATRNWSTPEIHGKVIAEVTFGFWHFMLAANYQTTLWAPALRRAFPHLRPVERERVYTPLDRLYRLRNRVAHHEPVHTINHTARHNELLRVAGWIDPAARAWISEHSRVLAATAPKP